jgi:hypothetical protein
MPLPLSPPQQTQQTARPGWAFDSRGTSGNPEPTRMPFAMQYRGPGNLYFEGPYVPAASTLYYGQELGPLTGR